MLFTVRKVLSISAIKSLLLPKIKIFFVVLIGCEGQR